MGSRLSISCEFTGIPSHLLKNYLVLVFEICLTSAIRTIGAFLGAGLIKFQEIGQPMYSHDFWTEFSWAHSPPQRAIYDSTSQTWRNRTAEPEW
jgi:hypothetical protein